LELTEAVGHGFNKLLAVLPNGLQVFPMQSRTHLDEKIQQRAVDRDASLTRQRIAFVQPRPSSLAKSHLLLPDARIVNCLFQDLLVRRHQA